MVHVSRSDEQQSAEQVILAQLNTDLQLNLSPVHLPLAQTISVQLDGYDESNRVVCEIYARIGRLKGSQPDKVASDLLKMRFVEQIQGGNWRKIFAFADPEAAKCLSGRSWLAAAAIHMNVEVRVIQLPASVREGLIAAQARQIMVNK